MSSHFYRERNAYRLLEEFREKENARVELRNKGLKAHKKLGESEAPGGLSLAEYVRRKNESRSKALMNKRKMLKDKK